MVRTKPRTKFRTRIDAGVFFQTDQTQECKECKEGEELNNPPPPPNHSASTSEPATSSNDDWAAAAAELISVGVERAPAVIQSVRDRLTPDRVIDLVEIYRTYHVARDWGPGALVDRLRNDAPGLDRMAGWIGGLEPAKRRSKRESWVVVESRVRRNGVSAGATDEVIASAVQNARKKWEQES